VLSPESPGNVQEEPEGERQCRQWRVCYCWCAKRACVNVPPGCCVVGGPFGWHALLHVAPHCRTAAPPRLKPLPPVAGNVLCQDEEDSSHEREDADRRALPQPCPTCDVMCARLRGADSTVGPWPTLGTGGGFAGHLRRLLRGGAPESDGGGQGHGQPAGVLPPPLQRCLPATVAFGGDRWGVARDDAEGGAGQSPRHDGCVEGGGWRRCQAQWQCARGSQSGPHRCCYCRMCCRCAIAGSVAGTMTRTIGESNGTTQLALPPDDDSPLFAKDKDGKSVMDTKDKAYQLETSITNWAAQIKDILKVRARAHFLAHGCPAGCARVRGRGRVRWRLMGWLRRAGQSGGGSQGG
jgi:hypothetical protein